jgi:hypothetical protein
MTAIECGIGKKEANMLVRFGNHYEEDNYRQIELTFMPSEYNAPTIVFDYSDLEKAVKILEGKI